MNRLFAYLLAAFAAGPAFADVPRVAVDIAPVEGLAARVMQGLGTPELVLRPGASPHDYAMRPSEALALEEADIVFLVSPGLTPWLEHAMERLSGNARMIALLEDEGSVRWDFRESVLFAPEDHAEGDDEHDHDHDHDGDHDHDHDHEAGATDPHGWLDPENARRWLDVMAEALAGADPEHAEAYRANAAAGKSEIAAAEADAAALLAPVKDRQYIVFHDAYQYFERRFGLAPLGAIALSDARAPGPRRITELRAALAEKNVTCAFSEPQFNPGLIETVVGPGVRVAEIDPLGTALERGAGFYPALIRDVVADVAECLGK